MVSPVFGITEGRKRFFKWQSLDLIIVTNLVSSYELNTMCIFTFSDACTSTRKVRTLSFFFKFFMLKFGIKIRKI